MNETTTSKMNHLEEQVSELLDLCKRLGKENSDLRTPLQHLSGERATLLEQKEQARSQVEAMITRLRSMESA
jgi:cell division protein ZapB